MHKSGIAGLARLLLICGLPLVAGLTLAADATDLIHPQSWPVAAPASPPDAKTGSVVEQLLAKMTIEEKVGQLIQADISAISPDDIRKYKLGSVLAGGNSAPGNDIRTGGRQWLELADAYYRASVAGGTVDHPAIPLLFGIDAVHGNTHIPGATVFPHNVGLGAANDPALIEKIGQATAEEIAAIGVDWTFAPTIAVVRDVRWGRSYESYSEDPALVAAYARAMVLGLQGAPGTRHFMAPGRTLATVKHFLGDGGTEDGRDQGNNLADEHTLRTVHGAGYPPAIEAGALTLMASYNSWHGTKMHANHALLTEVLKGRWHFPGFVVGDWNAHGNIPGCTKFDCPQALLAGLDMYMAPDGWQKLYENLLAEVRTGVIPQQRLDDAVRRILRVKVMSGLFARPAPSDRVDAGHFEQLGSAAHRAIAREAVHKSLVLLKNNGHVLPLDPRRHILVTGAGADNIGMQSGGWTIDWQGDHNTNADFPGATSIYAGIKSAADAAGGTATLSVDGSFATRPDAAIVVYGETPYAEFLGDRETLEFSPGDDHHLQILKRLHAAGIPVISVFLSGRPMWVNRELNASDAFVAAWLPGSEGTGVADELLRRPDGAVAADFTGRLGFSWPATAMPVRFSKSGAVSGALFKRGFGLTGKESSTLAALPEDPRIPPALGTADTLFHAGHITAPFSLYVGDTTSADTRVTTPTQASAGGAVTARMEPTALRTSWSGSGSGEVRIEGRAVDLHARLIEHASLVARYRVNARPAQRVRLGLRCQGPYRAAPVTNADGTARDWAKCGTPAGAAIDVTTAFAAAPLGAWQTLSVPLGCLAGTDADLSLVNAQFALETAGSFDISFSQIKLAAAAGDAACPGAAGP